MKDGKYSIVHKSGPMLPGTETGFLIVVDNIIKEVDGSAKELFHEGPVSPAEEFALHRLNNGYIHVVWSRLPKSAPEHDLDPQGYD